MLYSAAGNSADEHWYNRGIIGWDFEVGADVYNPETKRFQAVGFQPAFAEGHEEAMEFAAGQIGILEVASAFADDKKQPEVEAEGDRARPTRRPRSPSRSTSPPTSTTRWTAAGRR